MADNQNISAPKHSFGHRSLLFFVILLAFAFGAACRQDMHDQPKYKTLRPSNFFDDGRSARSQVEGTVARGQLKDDTLFYTGKETDGSSALSKASSAVATSSTTTPVASNPAATGSQDGQASPPLQTSTQPAAGQSSTGAGFSNTFPFPVTREVVDRGQERYNIYCSMCHGATGDGLGMVVRRGYRQPPPLYIERLRKAPAGYFYDVITNGFGAMPDYAAQITERDRWAIVAYLRALQISQQSTVADVPAEERPKLDQQKSQGHQ